MTEPVRNGDSCKNEFVIKIKTGNFTPATVDADFSIILYDYNGNASRPIRQDTLTANQMNVIVVPPERLKSIVPDSSIQKIEFWRDGQDTGRCFVERIVVILREARSAFALYFDVMPGTRYVIDKQETSLPQYDGPEVQKKRKALLEKRRKDYQFTQFKKGLPAEVDHQPLGEEFSTQYMWDILQQNVREAVGLLGQGIKHLFTGKTWKSIEDLEKIYDKDGVFNPPEGLKRWKSNVHKDVVFANQRINGLNSSVIALVTKKADIKKKMKVDDDMLKPLLEGMTLDQAIAAKRLFVVDLEILDGVPHKNDYTLCAPIGLFFVDSRQRLMPVAIQLFQKPGPKNPVFLPSTDWSWILAKMWFNNADAAYHQSITHLGFTHLLMEGVVVASHRQLSKFHPIFKLLAPHFRFLIAINWKARKILVNENGIIEKILNCGIEGCFELIRKRLKTWRMDTEGTLPKDMAQRGVGDPQVLPGYHFRNDAMLVYDAIKRYVTAYVNLYYVKPEDLTKDNEIQSWAAELVKPRDGKKGGCGLQGVPGGGKLKNTDDLITILTSVIYTCSVGHAAANFAQYDEYGFPPNYPGLLKGQPPTDTGHRTEEDVLRTLPDFEQTQAIMFVTKLLSQEDTERLGDFEETPTIDDPRALKLVNEFRANLAGISKQIEASNQTRVLPYTHCNPERVPNSIGI